DRDARTLHPLTYGAQEGLVVGRGEDVVVEDVGHRRRQVDVMLGVRFGERLLEQEELELRARHGLEAQRAGPLDLRPQYLTRRGADWLTVVPGHVAQHQRGGVEPGDAPQRRAVGPRVEV